jgi:hypothetical protein
MTVWKPENRRAPALGRYRPAFLHGLAGRKYLDRLPENGLNDRY